MHLDVIVPTDDSNLQDLKWFFLGLRQQTLDPEHWSVWIVHRGQPELLEQSVSPWQERLGQHVLINTLILPTQTKPGVLLNRVLEQISENLSASSLILILQAGFQPHRYLFEHHQRYHQRHPNAVVQGSNQYEPEQALTFWGMASQLEQLCFGFYPLASTQILPYTSCYLHNISLPRDLILALDESFASWRFCAWDLAFRWYLQGRRIQAHHDLRACLMASASFEQMTRQWQQDCHQDLAPYFAKYPFPLPGWELASTSLLTPKAAQETQGLWEQLSQTQFQPCVFLESETTIEKALLQWRQQLRRLWRNLALQVLQQNPVMTRLHSTALDFYPWRQAVGSADDSMTPSLLWQDWFQSDGAACRSLALHFQNRARVITEEPSFAGFLGLESMTGPQIEETPSVLAETALVFLMDVPFAQLLKTFLTLDQHLAPNSLLVLAPLKSNNIQDLQRLILAHYAWIELDSLAQTVILCRVAA